MRDLETQRGEAGRQCLGAEGPGGPSGHGELLNHDETFV